VGSSGAGLLSDRARVAAIEATGLVGRGPDEAFDRLTRLCARLLQAPVAMLSLVDVGPALPHEHTFCLRVVEQGRPLVIEDARGVPELATLAAVRERSFVACLAVPIVLDGLALGALTVLDHRPRPWSIENVETLAALALLVTTEISARLDADRRLQAEASLEESEGRLAAVIESAADAIVILDAAQRVRVFNRRAERVFGCRAEEVIGGTIERFLPAEFRGRHHGFVEAFGRSGVAERPMGGRQITALRADGTEFPAEAVISQAAVRGETLYTVILRDITERKQMEEALAGSEARLSAIVRSASDAIITIDPDHVVRVWNAGAEHIFECTAAEAVGKTLDRFIPLSFREAHREEVARFARTGEAARRAMAGREITACRADGAEFPAEAAVSRTVVDGEHLLTVILRDLTERKRMEAIISQAQKFESLGLLAGGVAHDFNNLLTAIFGNIGLARIDAEPGCVALAYVNEIESAARQAAGLARQMLIYSGRGKVVLELVDLNAVIAEMADLLRVALGKETTLVVEPDARLPLIEGDRTQLRQVVMNLLTNANEAIGAAPGRVTLRTKRLSVRSTIALTAAAGAVVSPGHYAVLEVADTGSGMDAETRQRIFDPFFTTKFTGRGLGLAALHGIVRSHGGAIDVESAPRLGTTFRVYFPAVREVQPEGREQGATPSG
jgi:PAS domain S-box-containing protein